MCEVTADTTWFPFLQSAAPNPRARSVLLSNAATGPVPAEGIFAMEFPTAGDLFLVLKFC